MEMIKFDNAVYKDRISLEAILSYSPLVPDVELQKKHTTIINNSTVLCVRNKYHNTIIDIRFNSRESLRSAINKLDEIYETRIIYWV